MKPAPVFAAVAPTLVDAHQKLLPATAEARAKKLPFVFHVNAEESWPALADRIIRKHID